MRPLFYVSLILLGLTGASVAEAVPTPKPRPDVPAPSRPTQEATGSVFLLRGLVNVFSLGMDDLGRKIRAKGIPVRVTNYSHWKEFGALLANKYRTDKSVVPVVIVGHSLGADAALQMGNYLAQSGVPVRLVIAFDGVNGGTVINGVEEVINYYKANGWGKIIKAQSGYDGDLRNIDLSDSTEIDHLNIDRDQNLHKQVVDEVVEVFGR